MANKRSFIPNLLTMINMLLGFIAIIFACKSGGQLYKLDGVLIPESVAIAGVLVFAAAIFDVFDGLAARALGVESSIGGQLDSLADCVSYGITPGIVSYQAYLNRLPEIVFGINLGMIIAMIFPVCAVYRLAKFNVAEKQDGFTGIPSPGAGIIVSSIPSLPLTVLPFIGPVSFSIPIEVFIPLYIIVALLMVSRIDYHKTFSDIQKRGKIAIIVTVAAVILLLIFFGMLPVFVLSTVYAFVGLVIYLIKSIRKPRL